MDRVRVPIWEKLNLTIEEAAAYSNIGTKRLYELTRNPKCSFAVHVGRRVLIKRKALEKYIENQVEI